MTTLKERVPKQLRTPVGILSYIVALIGVTVGYILVMLGIVLYYDLALDGEIGAAGSLIVVGTGVGAAVIGYLGIKGFMYFSY